MPAIVKFVVFTAVIALAGYIALYVLAVHFEPEPKEVRKSLPSIKIKR